MSLSQPTKRSQEATSTAKDGACSGAVGRDAEENQEFVKGLDNRVVSEDVQVKGNKVECTEEQIKVCSSGSVCVCVCGYVSVYVLSYILRAVWFCTSLLSKEGLQL